MYGLRKALLLTLGGLLVGANFAEAKDLPQDAAKACACPKHPKAKTSSPDEQDNNSSFPLSCPVYPVMDYGDYVLYYCDYFETACGVDPQPTYVGSEDPWTWPWQDCPQDCHSAFVRKSEIFDGLPAPVPFAYMHAGKFPQGTNLNRVRVNPNRNNHFVEIPIPENDAVVTKYAKLLEFEIPQGNFQAPGGVELIRRFIAFEVAGGDPRSSGGDVVRAQEPIIKLPGEHAYRVQVSTGLGSKSAALILLAK